MAFDALPNSTALAANLDSRNLYDAAQLLAAGVDKRCAVPITQCAEIVAKANRLRMSTTDFDAKVSVYMPFPGEDGAACIPVADILAAAKRAKPKRKADSDTFVTMRATADNATLSGGGASQTVAAWEPIHFPDFRDVEDSAPSIETDAFDMLQAFDAVAFAMSREETRYYLNGVFVEARGGKARLVTTDGHRLAAFDMGAECNFPAGVILPARAVGLMQKALRLAMRKSPKGCPPLVTLATDQNRVTLRIGKSVVITSKTIDGTFPDYERVIPKAPFKGVATVNRAALAAAADALPDGACAKLAFATEGESQSLTVSREWAESGVCFSQSAKMAARGPDGFAIGFNASYLWDVAAAFAAFEASRKDDQLALEVRTNTPADPTIFAGDFPDCPLIVVLMPMRI